MASTRRPNVVVFFTDQQRWDTIGAYGSPLDLTPNLDRLAARSVRFERAFTCQPVCGPARASLQTGLYAAATGVFRNGEALPEDADTLARRFGAAGYRTGYIGKWHLSGTRDRPAPANLRGGYDHWIASDVLEFTSHPYEGHLFDADDRPVEFTGWRSDFLTEKALEFIDAGDGPLTVAQAPRMHVEAAEPVQVTESLGEETIGGLREMGHEIEAVAGVAGAMHSADFDRAGGTVRAGGNHWAAAVE